MAALNSPSPGPSRTNTSLPALPGLLLSKALVVWQSFGKRGAQTAETPLRSTRHTACPPSTFPASRGRGKSGKSRKKGKQIAKMSRCRLPTGWNCSSHAGELLWLYFLAVKKSFWVMENETQMPSNGLAQMCRGNARSTAGRAAGRSSGLGDVSR